MVYLTSLISHVVLIKSFAIGMAFTLGIEVKTPSWYVALVFVFLRAIEWPLVLWLPLAMNFLRFVPRFFKEILNSLAMSMLESPLICRHHSAVLLCVHAGHVIPLLGFCFLENHVACAQCSLYPRFKVSIIETMSSSA